MSPPRRVHGEEPAWLADDGAAARLADLPVRGVFDGELVAFGDEGRPDFDLVRCRLLHGDAKVPLAFVVFDVLGLRGRSLVEQTYRQRRARLTAIDFRGVTYAPEAFDDGERCGRRCASSG